MEEGQGIKAMALRGDISLFFLRDTGIKKQRTANRSCSGYCVFGGCCFDNLSGTQELLHCELSCLYR